MSKLKSIINFSKKRKRTEKKSPRECDICCEFAIVKNITCCKGKT